MSYGEAKAALTNIKTVTPEDVQAILDWIDEGEKIFADHRFGALFRLGCWWADRPWRRK